jgi:chaperone modulatory protein CbpM
MPLPDEESLTGEIVGERVHLSVADLCRLFAVDERQIIDLVEEGALSVVEIETREWRFSGATLRRARIALRLERDLGINAPGAALVLELLEELEELRRGKGRP